MLIQFRVQNFRSFKDEAVLSMVAAPLKDASAKALKDHCFTIADGTSLLRSAAIYGANASGKSNLIAAIRFMRKFVLDSSKEGQTKEAIPVEPFRLNTATALEPSFFEAIFSVNKTTFRYGFMLDQEKVVSEWLSIFKNDAEKKLFTREANTIKVTAKFKEGKGLEEKTRNNALFLSVAAQFNGRISTEALSWFDNLKIIMSSGGSPSDILTLLMMGDSQCKDDIVAFLKAMDSSIEDIRTRKSEIIGGIGFLGQLAASVVSEKDYLKLHLLENHSNTVFETFHRIFDDKGEPCGMEIFSMEEQESSGTQKVLSLAGPLLTVLKKGWILVVDELDARLHPSLTKTLIHIFSDSKTNPLSAQLIFATHDIGLLDREIFRRDQIWFTEKDKYGATSLYSLAEFKMKDMEPYAEGYVRGRYGAVPFTRALTLLMESPNE